MNREPEGTEHSNERLDSPYADIDETLEEFAAVHDLTLERDSGLETYRYLRCRGPVDCLIEVHLDGDNDGKWYLWISAAEQKAGGRRYKRRNLHGPVERPALHSDLRAMLNAAWREISGWQDQQPGTESGPS